MSYLQTAGRWLLWLLSVFWGACLIGWRQYRYTRQANRLGAAMSLAAAQSSGCTVFFSPRGGCTDAITAAVRQSQRSVLVQAYSFTSKPVAQALIDAQKRGVRVRVIVDGDQRTARSCVAQVCRDAGIEVVFDCKHVIAHNKVVIIDEQLVITGSFNFSASAENVNAENLLLINDAVLAASYAASWQRHRDHSEV